MIKNGDFVRFDLNLLTIKEKRHDENENELPYRLFWQCSTGI